MANTKEIKSVIDQLSLISNGDITYNDLKIINNNLYNRVIKTLTLAWITKLQTVENIQRQLMVKLKNTYILHNKVDELADLEGVSITAAQRMIKRYLDEKKALYNEAQRKYSKMLRMELFRLDAKGIYASTDNDTIYTYNNTAFLDNRVSTKSGALPTIDNNHLRFTKQYAEFIRGDVRYISKSKIKSFISVLNQLDLDYRRDVASILQFIVGAKEARSIVGLNTKEELGVKSFLFMVSKRENTPNFEIQLIERWNSRKKDDVHKTIAAYFYQKYFHIVTEYYNNSEVASYVVTKQALESILGQSIAEDMISKEGVVRIETPVTGFQSRRKVITSSKYKKRFIKNNSVKTTKDQ